MLPEEGGVGPGRQLLLCLLPQKCPFGTHGSPVSIQAGIGAVPIPLPVQMSLHPPPLQQHRMSWELEKGVTDLAYGHTHFCHTQLQKKKKKDSL